MPRTHRKLPIFDKSGSQVLAHKSSTELKQMLSTGEAIHACRRCGGPGTGKRCNGKSQGHDMIHAATDLFRDTITSACYITEGDMRAFVGESSVGRQKRAEQKIKSWPTVGDDRAVRVGPRV